MSDDILWSGSEPTTTSPTRSGRRRVPPATLVGVGVALAVAAGAFYAGRVTAPSRIRGNQGHRGGHHPGATGRPSLWAGQPGGHRPV